MKILILGSGADSIGKTGELDRFAVDGMRYLQQHGHEMVLMDQNPTSMASVLGMAHRVYAEPLTLKFIERIIEMERPDGVMPCFGGSLGAHLVIFLDREGILDRCGTVVLGTSVQHLRRFMDWEILKKGLRDAGIPLLEAAIALNTDACVRAAKDIGFPLILRPSFASEGIGGYLAFNREEVKNLARLAFNLSPVLEVVLERVPSDWVQIAVEAIGNPHGEGEFQLVGTFEALDGGVGVHPGNSILVAPAPTLVGKLLDEAMELTARICKVTRICGSFQVRIGLSPDLKQLIVLRIIPHLNRFSSFLSSFYEGRLGQINAALSLGESFESVIKDLPPGISFGRAQLSAVRLPIPFEEFQQKSIPDTTMRTVGAAIYCGQSTEEALAKAVGFIRGSELFDGYRKSLPPEDGRAAIYPNPTRVLDLMEALKHDEKGIERFIGLNKAFLAPLRKISCDLREAAESNHSTLVPIHDTVGEGTYVISNQTERTAICGKGKMPGSILILGSGPYKIGLGTDIDQALFSTALHLRNKGKRLILLNNNPDSFCNDPSVFDAVCLEMPSLGTIQAVLDRFQPQSLIHQFCMDPPSGLQALLTERGVDVLGTPLDQMDRLTMSQVLWPELKRLGIPIFSFRLVPHEMLCFEIIEEIGYPAIVQLTDRRFGSCKKIVYNESMLESFIEQNRNCITEQTPLLIQKFEEGLTAAEVLGLSDGQDVWMAGFLECIEEYGTHTGDCAAIFPSISFGSFHEASAKDLLQRVARHFGIVGHIRLEVVAKGRNIFMTGLDTRPGYGVPLLERTHSRSIHEFAASLLLGESICELQIPVKNESTECYVKEVLLPFDRFPELDPVLSPQMRSTGQVIGRDRKFGNAYIKAQMAVYPSMTLSGKVFLSVRDRDKESILLLSHKLLELGFPIVSTEGTALFLARKGIKVDKVHKVSSGRPNIIDLIKNGQIGLVINIPGGVQKEDELAIRRATVEYNIPFVCTMSGAFAITQGIEEFRKNSFTICPIFEINHCKVQG